MKTAKEWLQEYRKDNNLFMYVGIGNGYMGQDLVAIDPLQNNPAHPIELLLERFANYRTKELQAKILSFYKLLEKYYMEDCDFEDMKAANELLDKYKTHFGITEARDGKI